LLVLEAGEAEGEKQGASLASGHGTGPGQATALCSSIAAEPLLLQVLVFARAPLHFTQVRRGAEWWRSAHPELLPRALFVMGDMFDASTIPPPLPTAVRPAYVLRNILHNWDDAEALQILK
jgi:hypothetical protein